MITERYNLKWRDQDDLQIEMACVQKGGKWTMKGVEYGEGMFFHFRKMQSLLWPDDDHNRWSDLILKTILENRITVVQGSRDSGKTRTMSKYALTDYFCFPNETLTLMSSTDIRGLELRVWGDIKDLFDRAREKWEYLAGNVVDAKHGVFTDSLGEDADVRDMRRGILCIPCIGSDGQWSGGLEKFVGIKQKRRRLLGDECFPAGTMIDTPTGPKAIETFIPGDVVVNALGIGMVSAVMEKKSDSLLRIILEGGSSFDCTPNHPIFTDLGLVNAVDITAGTKLLSVNDTLSCVQEGNSGGKISNPILFQSLSKRNMEEAVQGVRSPIYTERAEGAILYKKVLLRMEMEPTVISSKAKKGVVKSRVSSKARRRNQQGDSRKQEREKSETGFDNQESAETSTRTKEIEADNVSRISSCEPKRDDCSRDVSRSEDRLSGEHRNECKTGSLTALQSGPCVAGTEAGCGSGRIVSPNGKAEIKGSKAGQVLSRNRVDRVEILKQDSALVPYDCKSGYTVYNLQVEGHPSYSVNGVIVSNCQFMHINYINTLSNLDKGEFRGCFVGNPIGGNGKALDKMAEPEAGWDSLGEIEKTCTWKNRLDGVTVNLVGIDSPNFDADRPKHYPYLIDQDDVARVLKRSGKDSGEYWSQIMGVRKLGVDTYRVLTRAMCLRFDAYKTCIWSGNETTRVLGIDAGYGGDPCEAVLGEFGEDVTGQTVIKLNQTITIPLMMSSKDSVEDQIAIFVKGLLPQLNVPPTNVFFEAGMRASLAISMARIVGIEVNAVNFGGAATDRPVSNDTFTFDEKTQTRRLKKASEHYSKYVTQAWFSIRQAVESYQVREMPEDVVSELSMREWRFTNGNRYELETKAECKERMGSSPNKADAVAVMLEGAQRLGFIIERMKVDSNDALQQNDSWLDKALKEDRTKRSKFQLNYRS